MTDFTDKYLESLSPENVKKAADFADQLVGKVVEEAKALAEAANYMVDVISKDDRFTMDHRTDRVRLTVEDGKVVKAAVG